MAFKLNEPGALIVGCVVIAFGLWAMLSTIIRQEAKVPLRFRLRWRDGSRQSRFAQFCLGVGFANFGMVLVGNGFFHWPLFAHPLPIVFSGLGIMLLGVAQNAFADWKATGFALRTRCKHCGAGLDFKRHTGICPRCHKEVSTPPEGK